MADWCNPKHDFVSATRSVGTVVSNGKLSQEMINFALSNQTPLYALADGVFRDKLMDVHRGEIIFTTHDSRVASCASSCSSDPYFIERENCTMKGLTVANGQGDGALSNFDFMNTIQVMGIAEMDNNCRDRFNVVSDGIHDVRNNGNLTITVGDTVIAYAPTPEEVRNGGGKNQREDERSGVVRLWFVPYRKDLHAMTLKGMYMCLQDVTNAKNYLPAYRRACHQFLDSAMGMSMVVMARLLPELREAFTGPAANRFNNDAEILTFLMAKSGHSDYRNMPGADPLFRNSLINSLFVPFSTEGRNTPEYIFSGSNEGATKREKDLRRRLNDTQQRSTPLFIESVAYFHNQLQNQTVGRAKSTARPGMDFSIKIDK